MKITPLRTVALVGASVAILLVSSNKASADSFSIQVGVPPPPLIVEHPWAPPYAGAVWIGGHHEWVGGHWVWVGGYYTYPPHGAHWIRAHYHNGYYYPGRWGY